MSQVDPTQALVDSVDNLTAETSELLERYTQAIFGVEQSASNAASDAQQTAADRVQTGIDAQSASDSAATAVQAAQDAEAVTQLATFQQYRDEAQTAAASTATDVIAAQASADAAADSAASIQASEVNVTNLEQQAGTHEANAQASAGSAATSEDNAADSAASAAADAAQTAQDRVQTGADRIQTGQDAASASSSASSANASKNAAQTAAGQTASDLTAVQSLRSQVATDAAAAATSEANAQASADSIASSASQISANATAIAQNASAIDAEESARGAGDNALQGQIDDINDLSMVMTEAESNAIREQNRRKFAASDFVYHGRHYDSPPNYNPINEGLWTAINSPNVLIMGPTSANISSGSSKTANPLFNMDGILLPIKNINQSIQYGQSNLLFPEAPNGTVTYDSATGVVTDFTIDVDPKYGDVASTVNEAVSRAFEGDIRNGDFRNGVSNWSVRLLSATPVTNGIQLSSAQGGIYQDIAVTAGVAQKLKVVLSSTNESNTRALIYDGSAFTTTLDDTVFDVGTTPQVWETTVVPTQSTVRVYLFINTATTVAVFNSAMLSAGTREVVTQRVDMTALEFFPELITDDEVFLPCIQNQSTTFGDTGIPTVVSGRPESYFQVFAGQTGIQKGRCVKWSTLTYAQKHAVAAYLGESFYKTADGLVQWRVRNRGFAGPGNGNWEYLTYEQQLGGTYAPGFEGNGRTRLVAQGSHNSIDETFTDSTTKGYGPYGSSAVINTVRELSKAIDPTKGYKGECYIYVIAAVPRLNQGVYHPLNQWGAAGIQDTSIDDRRVWTHSTAKKPLSLKDCFSVDFIPTRTDGQGRIGGIAFRPLDGRYHNAIYPSGLGGVIDHRLKYGAWDASSPEKAEAVRNEIITGVYRGRENLLRSKVEQTNVIITLSNTKFTSTYTGIATSAIFFNHTKNDWRFGFIYATGDIWVKRAGIKPYSYSVYNDNFYQSASSSGWSSGDVVSVISQRWSDISLEGEYTHLDVLGTPTDIEDVPELRNGWIGGYLPRTNNPELSRKSLSSSINIIFTNNSGASWSVGTFSVNTATNVLNVGVIPGGDVHIYPYTATAKSTIVSSNKPVLHGVQGLCPVFVTMHSSIAYGALLLESALGVIGKDNTPAASGVFAENLALTKVMLWDTGSLPGGTWVSLHSPKHVPIELTPPQNNSRGGKVLFYQLAENEQCTLNVQANELIYTTDWGDDSVLHNEENSIFSNSLGQICRAVTHKLANPYGWITDEI